MGTKSRPVIIVGAGLFGSIAAKVCAEHGFKVLLIDNKKSEAGSKAAACLMKPSWLTMLDKESLTIANTLLRKYYSYKELTFQSSKAMVQVGWVPPKEILCFSPIKETVLNVGDGTVTTDKGIYKGNVLVAAGVWSGGLVDLPEIKALTGTALHFKGQTKPTISIWAPYKQSVKFNLTANKIWYGDGTSILRKNFSVEHIDKTRNRAKSKDLYNPTKIIVGQRPSVAGHGGGYFKRTHKHTWVSTGGAKNGTVLAALQAYLFVKEIT
jgi:glycine/D-amino acid oxidase-like deaminating enzyme